MSYPTFAGFVAPADGIQQWESQQWMDALVGLCDLSTMVGKFCDTSYFGVSQEVIATMVISGVVKKGGPPPPPADVAEGVVTMVSISDQNSQSADSQPQSLTSLLVAGSCLALAIASTT